MLPSISLFETIRFLWIYTAAIKFDYIYFINIERNEIKTVFWLLTWLTCHQIILSFYCLKSPLDKGHLFQNHHYTLHIAIVLSDKCFISFPLMAFDSKLLKSITSKRDDRLYTWDIFEIDLLLRQKVAINIIRCIWSR